jgi:putative nucleotidyltransferase with HDIG domain
MVGDASGVPKRARRENRFLGRFSEWIAASADDAPPEDVPDGLPETIHAPDTEAAGAVARAEYLEHVPVETGQGDDLAADFLPMPLRGTDLSSLLRCDIYLRVQGQFVLYRSHNQPFTVEARQRLAQLQTPVVYLRVDDVANLLDQTAAHLDELISRQQLPELEQVARSYAAAVHVVQAAWGSPSFLVSGTALERSARRLVFLLKRSPRLLLEFINQMPRRFADASHSVNVAVYASALSIRLGLPAAELEAIALGAFLHDIGKAPWAVKRFLPPEVTAPSERTSLITRQHPLWGATALQEMGTAWSESVRRIVREHQERYDGSGYPEGKSGSDLLLESQIVALADVYDALTTTMPYRQALRPFEALRLILGEMRSYFHPSLVTQFVYLFLPQRAEQES